MARKGEPGYIRIRDFGGGLNTALAEALLPNNMSADMYNFDVLDTNALKTRSGYAADTSLGGVVKALNKLYLENGNSYWFTVIGTYVYTRQLGASEYSASAEAEDMSPTRGYNSYTGDGRFDGSDFYYATG